MLKVVIVGYGEMFTNLIAAALDAGCEIVGVLRKDMTKYPPIIRKLKDIFNPSKEYNYIKSYNLREIEAKSVNSESFRKKLLKLNPDIMLVGSWGEKIEKKTYDIPKMASINAHPSLLPKYRGPNPYFWTIKNMEKTSGITLHLIDEGFDTGAILAQEEVEIYPTDTGKSLKERTVLKARITACELLKALREDIIIPLSQREDKACYYSHPDDLELDFSKSAEENSALIRAAHPWAKAYFYYKGELYYPNPHSIKIEEKSSDFIETPKSILCGDGKVLKFSLLRG